MECGHLWMDIIIVNKHVVHAHNRSCNCFVGPWSPFIIRLPKITHTPPVACSLPIKSLVARQWLTSWTYCACKLWMFMLTHISPISYSYIMAVLATWVLAYTLCQYVTDLLQGGHNYTTGTLSILGCTVNRQTNRPKKNNTEQLSCPLHNNIFGIQRPKLKVLILCHLHIWHLSC